MAVSGPATAQLRALRTEELNLVHWGTTRYLAPHVARCFQNAYEFHHETFGWTPSEPVTVLLHDFYDHGNAAAASLPKNNIFAAISPFSYAFDILPGNEHLNWMMNHELVHVLTSDMAAGRDVTARKLFHGKVYPSAEQPLSMAWSFLTTPRIYTPRWYMEGIASFMETWMAGGLGRAQSAYDEMAFRTMVRDGKPIYDLAGLESSGTTAEFQVGANNYLYGTRFMTWLAETYGPEKLIEWVARREGTAPHFAVQFQRVFGLSLPEAWSKWTADEEAFQRANLGRIAENPVTKVEPVTDRALGSVSRPALDRANGRVYLAVSYPGRIAHLTELDLATGALRPLIELKGASLFWVTSIALDPESRTLFYVTDNNDYRDLHALDLSTGKTRLLMKDARVGDLAFDPSDRSLWGIRHYNGLSTLVRVPPPYTEWNQVHTFSYGTDLYSIDVSPDGAKLVGALTKVDGSQSLALWDVEKLRAGESEPATLGEFESSSPADFVFTPDGRSLYGSSYYSGVSNLYRYDFGSGDIDALTNTDSGLFRPVPLDDHTLFALAYTARGFQPVRLPIAPVEKVSAIEFLGARVAEDHPIVREWNVGSPADIDLDAVRLSDETYSIAGSLGLVSAYPILEGYKDSIAGGVHVDLRDPVGLSGLGLTLSWSPDDELLDEERLHFLARYRYFDWTVHASWNRADFYDLFGPTKRGRKGYAVGVDWGKALILDEPNRRLGVRASAAGYGDLDTLPGFQNVASPADELVEAEAALDYHSVRRSLGAIEREAGVELELRGGDQLVSGEHFPYAILDFATGAALPIEHSTVWLHTSVGGSFGDRDNAFGNLYFGGFRNNYVDHLESRRFRETFALPGFEIDEISAHRFGKALVEWSLPPLRLEAGSSSAWLDWLGVSLFGGGIVTDFDDGALQREFGSFGVQADLRFTVRTHLKFTLSLGAAYGKENGGESSEEYLISLKLPPL